MSLPTPPMRLVTQRDAGDRHWDDCLPSSGAMAVRRATNMNQLPTWRELRAELETMGIHDEPNVTNPVKTDDIVRAIKRRYGISPVEPTGPSSYPKFLLMLSAGNRGAIVAGDYPALGQYRQASYTSGANAARHFGHGIYVEYDPTSNEIAVYDPLRAADTKPVRVPVAHFRDFATSYGRNGSVAARVYAGSGAPVPAPKPTPTPAPKPAAGKLARAEGIRQINELLAQIKPLRWGPKKAALWARIELIKRRMK